MLVIAGIILVAVLKGTDAVNKAKVERMVADLRGLQGTLLEFHKRTGRYAGDCDNSGIVNNNTLPLFSTLMPTFAGTAVGTSVIYDNQETLRVMPPVAVSTVGANGTCIASTTTEVDINLPWNELRRAGVVDSNRLPRELARHGFNDMFAIGSMTSGAVDTGTAGIIVAYGVPVWMAEAVDASIDGAATTYGAAAGVTAGGATNQGPATTGRVRLWNGSGGTPMAAGTAAAPHIFTPSATTASYDQGVNDRDRLVSISFQYTTEKLLR